MCINALCFQANFKGPLSILSSLILMITQTQEAEVPEQNAGPFNRELTNT